MPVFKVPRQVDAWITYVAEESADDAEQAAEVARDSEGDLRWEEEGPVEFDARQFVTLDGKGFEIDCQATRNSGPLSSRKTGPLSSTRERSRWKRIC